MRNHYHKRTNHPSYRHIQKRRQFKPLKVTVIQNDEIDVFHEDLMLDEVDSFADIDSEIEKTAAQETLTKLPKTFFSSPKQTRKERRWASREAEIDGLIARKKYNTLHLLLHPYHSMVSEYEEDIPANIFVGIIRMVVKWLVLGFFIGEEVRRIVEISAFSFMRIEYPHVFSLTIRLALLFTLAEVLLYVCHAFLSLFSSHKISIHRLITAGSMLYLWEIIGYVISVIVGMIKDPLLGLLIAFAITLMAMMLKNQAMIDKTNMSHELVTFVSVSIVFIAAFCILKYLDLTEKHIIEIFIQQHL